MGLRYASFADEAYRFPLTIRHLLGNVLATSAEQKIIYRDQASITYAQFVERIGRLASLLAGIGVEPGMTVAVMDWDSHRYLESYFAIPMMGAVLETVNIRLPAPQVAYTLEHAHAEVVLVHRDFFPFIDSILPSLPAIKAIVAISDGEDGPLPTWAVGEYEALSAAASPDYPFEDFDENAVATTFYTTGTTGNPKGVCFTHRQIVLQTLASNAPFGAQANGFQFGYGDVYMPLTPMFHVHAWGTPYVATMLGLKQIYPGRYKADMICDLRTEHKVTYSHCVPTILQMVLDEADRTGCDLQGWKMMVGGSALTRALYTEARRHGMEVAAGYGMSETAPLVSVCRPIANVDDEESLVESLTCAGVPAPLVEARIVDEAMRDLPRDGKSRGELVLRAPWLTPCYVDNETASRDLWRGGWMHTQDIATIDGYGRIRICDRLKDVIKTGGEWINSIQLEELVATAQGVAAVSVIAVPDVRWGERPLAIIIVEAAARPTLADLNAPVEQAIAGGHITRYARLDRFEIVEELPKTSVGKIDKKALRARFIQQTSSPNTGQA